MIIIANARSSFKLKRYIFKLNAQTNYTETLKHKIKTEGIDSRNWICYHIFYNLQITNIINNIIHFIENASLRSNNFK